jgi:hypothetical protein
MRRPTTTSSFTQPIPTDGRLNRSIRRMAEHTQNAKLIAKIAHEGDARFERPATARFEFPNPVDMRGIPALGRGVGGTIRGTRPDAICDR